MKKLQIILALILLLATLSSVCNEQAKQSVVAIEYKLNNGKSIFITESHPVGQSLSTIGIKSRGFEQELNELINDVDPISAVLVADLNRDGFDEIYIILTAAGSGSYGSVIGFASNNDKSLSQIHIPDHEQDDLLFADYHGHDMFSIDDNKLLRIFPVYSSDSIDVKRRIYYVLKPGEAAWQLEIENGELELMKKSPE